MDFVFIMEIIGGVTLLAMCGSMIYVELTKG
jgi:hypothetical protein